MWQRFSPIDSTGSARTASRTTSMISSARLSCSEEEGTQCSRHREPRSAGCHPRRRPRNDPTAGGAGLRPTSIARSEAVPFLRIDEDELERELQESPLWTRLREYSDRNGNGAGRPPLPLHSGHLGLLLASGYLDGVVGEREDRHVVRGKVEKITHREEEYDGDTLIERETESYRVSVKLLKRDGEIVTLM